MKYFLHFLIIAVMIFSNASVFAKEIQLAVGIALPPYIIKDTNKGMEIDIVREALAIEGYTVIPKYVPFARITIELKKATVDGALTINESSRITSVYYTDSHITYQNVAVSLKKNNYKINNIDDLWNKKIVTFQNATKYLGQEFREAAKASPGYRELAKQELQVGALFRKRTDTIVLDINIFKYYRKTTKQFDTSAPVTIHKIFPETHYKVGFIKPDIRDKFNKGLKKLRDSGRYNDIISEYVK